jgi:hypothetical protein
MSGKKVDHIPDALTRYELCETFGWTPEELDEQDNKTIEEFIVIMNAKAEHENKKNKKEKRKETANKFGSQGR